MKRIGIAMLLGMLLAPAAVQAEGQGGTIEDVWMRNGGARLYYDALTQPRQMYLNGARWTDPAFIHRMPPLFTPQKERGQRASSGAAAGKSAPASRVAAPTAAPAASRPGGAALTPPRSGAAASPGVVSGPSSTTKVSAASGASTREKDNAASGAAGSLATTAVEAPAAAGSASGASPATAANISGDASARSSASTTSRESDAEGANGSGQRASGVTSGSVFVPPPAASTPAQALPLPLSQGGMRSRN